ncbi:MAG TPA: ATP-binding protein, partial [Nitrospiria bacterium]|nr:ATP-binding protein [Nitrospiria bacterium]
RGKFGRDPIRDFRVDFLSPQTEVVIGYRPEEFKRDPALWSTLLEPEDLPAVAEATHKLIQTGLPVVRVYRLRHKNKGESRWIEDRVSPILDPNGGVYGMMGVARDITDRVKLEEELRHAGKLEAIGQLAGGIAHEFNNLLTSVIGHLELTRQQIEKTSPLVPLIATAEQAAHKGISLTQQLLTFSRRTPPSSEPVDLGKVSEEVIRLLRLTFDRRIQVRVEADSDLWSVKADANQMNQIVMNLCVNARDSATEKMDVNQTGLKKDWKPKITVKAANRALLEKDVVHHAAGRPGDFVCLSVTDNGLGISRKTRERMFDPFFTTKPVGVGTGLGLSTVHGIVQQHHGWIEVDSTEGEGTTFRVYLEKCAQSAKPLERKADT